MAADHAGAWESMRRRRAEVVAGSRVPAPAPSSTPTPAPGSRTPLRNFCFVPTRAGVRLPATRSTFYSRNSLPSRVTAHPFGARGPPRFLRRAAESQRWAIPETKPRKCPSRKAPFQSEPSSPRLACSGTVEGLPMYQHLVRVIVGGEGGNRTRDRAFAEPGLTTWLPRRRTHPLRSGAVLKSRSVWLSIA